jgi:hypothetical protein
MRLVPNAPISLIFACLLVSGLWPWPSTAQNDGKMTEVARMKLSEAGWQALADDAINVRAKSI